MLPEDIRNAPVPDNEKLASHWDGFLKELVQTPEYEGGLTVKQRYAIIRASAEYIGKRSYSDIDCSKLIRELYEVIGIDLSGLNSYRMARYAYENDWNIDRGDLQPGDLIFWEKEGAEQEGKWAGIHHVGIYLYTDDKGQAWIIDSTPSEGGPAVQKLWGDKKRTSTGSPVYGYASLHPNKP